MRRKPRKSKYVVHKQTIHYKRFGIVVIGVFVVFFLAVTGIIARYWISNLSDTSDAIVNPVAADSRKRPFEEVILQYDIALESVEYPDSGNKIVLNIVDGPRVVLSGTKDIEHQLKLLESIRARLRIENKTPMEIELYHNKPIVKF